MFVNCKFWDIFDYSKQINWNIMETKRILMAILMLAACFSYAQETSDTEKKNTDNLKEVVYYHDNGVMAQKGTFNSKGKLHGTWVSYDVEGKKTMIGSYENNKKVGKWLIWQGDILKEVEYSNSEIISISEWQDKVQLAVNDF